MLRPCLPFIFGLFTSQVVCDEKLWLPNLEWEVADNWQDSQLPVAGSRIKFPLEMRHTVGLPFGTFKFSGIDLSRDGSLAFSKNGKIEIYDSDQSSDKVYEWAKSGTFFWTDPSNWKYSSEATPHLQRVPCSSDTIILASSDRVLDMRLPLTDIEVASVRVTNFTLGRYEWWDFRNKREFARQRFTVRYSNSLNCQGCPCQESKQDDYLEEICDIQRPRCKTLCHDSLKIEGHCCDFCGGRVLIPDKIFFPKIKRTVNKVLVQFENAVEWYVRKNSNGETEILVTEKEPYDGIKSKQVVESLELAFRDENIPVKNVLYSGDPFQRSSLFVALWPVLCIPVMFILLLLITSLCFGHSYKEIRESWYEFWTITKEAVFRKSEKIESFNFARFENVPEGNVQLASPFSEINQVDDQLNPNDGAEAISGGRFENPLYRSKRSGEKGKVDESDTPCSSVPMSMTELQRNSSDDQIEEVEMKFEDI